MPDQPNVYVRITYGLGEDDTPAPDDGQGCEQLALAIQGRFPSFTVEHGPWVDDVAERARGIWEANPGTIIVLGGHSYGGNRSVKAANKLGDFGIPVANLFVFDGVQWGLDQVGAKPFDLKPNILYARNYYRGAIMPPWSSLFKVETDKWKNIHCPGTTHNSLPHQQWIHDEVISTISVYAPT